MIKPIYIDRLATAILIIVWLLICLPATFAQCPNDLCINAIEIGCEPVSFTNVDCTDYDFDDNNMSRLVGSCNWSHLVQCGGNTSSAFHADMWFTFEINETGYYDLNTFTDYSCDGCGSSSGDGGIRTFLWYSPTGSCEDAYIVYSQLCSNAVCWAGNIGDYTGDEGEYGQHSYSMMLEFLETGRYYFHIDAWGNGVNHPNYSYSIGSGTVSICPSSPLSSKPELFYRNSRLEWEGNTQTDWAVFKLIDLTWTEIVRTNNRHIAINQSGYYIVAGSSGFSNAVRVEFPSAESLKGFNILGQETDKMIIK